MFSYYLKSLHNYREDNLEVGKATSQACLDLVSSCIEGQYIFSKAMLHQGVRTFNGNQSDLESFWSIRFDDDMHQQLMLNWFDAHVEKNNHLHQLFLDAIKQHASGLNALTTELLFKLKRDLPEVYADNLDTVKAALASVTEAEESFVNAAESGLLPVKLPATRARKAAAHASGLKPAVKAVTVKGKAA